MKTDEGFSFWGFFWLCIGFFFLPLLAVKNAVAAFFYIGLYLAAALLFSLVIEPPYTTVLAICAFAVLANFRVYGRLEWWLLRNNVSRTLFLIAIIAASALCGRLLGIYAHSYLARTSPVSTFQVLGAAFFVVLNVRSFFARTNLNLSQCLSPRHIVR